MEYGEQTWAIINERSAVASLRRKVDEYAALYGFNNTIAESLRLLITEAGNNVLIHAKTGTLGIIPDVNKRSISILAIDIGGGMANIEDCMRDGVTSLEKSAGVGLGSMQRLSTRFHIDSVPQGGTVVCCTLDFSHEPTAPAPFNFTFLNRPYRNERVSGDQLRMRYINGEPWLLIVDGLGHGAKAHSASTTACNVFMERSFGAPHECIEILHAALHTTRGAAAAVLRIRTDDEHVEYCGIGNTQAYFQNFTGRAGHLLSKNGTLGHTMRRVETNRLEWPPGARLILNTDGVSTKAHFRNPAHMMKADPLLMAGVMVRDYGKLHDDCSIIIAEKARDASSEDQY